MREIRPSGSEGGAGRKSRSYLYQGFALANAGKMPAPLEMQRSVTVPGV
jgi:hypothetical protein